MKIAARRAFVYNAQNTVRLTCISLYATLWLSHFKASGDDTMIRTKQKHRACVCACARKLRTVKRNEMNNAKNEAFVCALIFLAGVKNMAPILQTIVCWTRAHTKNEPTFNPKYTHPHIHTLNFYANAITNYKYAYTLYTHSNTCLVFHRINLHQFIIRNRGQMTKKPTTLKNAEIIW